MRREFEFFIDDLVFWIDSIFVFKYIMNEDRRFYIFVVNRVVLICDGLSLCQWRYIQFKQNFVDDVLRGLIVDVFFGSLRWLLGLEFLMKIEDYWLKCIEIFERILDEDLEVKKEVKVGGVL